MPFHMFLEGLSEDAGRADHLPPEPLPSYGMILSNVRKSYPLSDFV